MEIFENTFDNDGPGNSITVETIHFLDLYKQ